uniref:ATP synthase subunit d, mitochondrial n=1 Tax=Helicotheca tamesis TaxID=374047 RepID=A0A7S2IGI0_9STRA|eukprot:CAMPEP_0185728870 /NCGR_PEP_ID=MMETSP1171-20130828/4271_1 /TAXON_ID=374046 /ORGANISM="Helicotheca tamensis, Strain CCMP826" /LENGTH=173 /DNA_ID=CAMNT_0028397619 /DNA_START=47 /DNA_END=568 /DNA_ORIENTATION=+
MSFSGTVRRVATRKLTQRSIDWAAPVFKSGDHELAAQVARFRAWAGAAESMAEKYSAPPAPIDFAKAKESVRDKALVEALEKLYATSTPPAEVHEWSAEDQADKAQQIEDAKGRLSFTQEMIEETEAELEFLRANRTSRETSGNDLKENFPDIAEEVETEVENREWFKDTLSK